MACINIEEEEKRLAGPTPPEMNPDFLIIRIVGRIVISVIKQCWAISSAMFVSVVLFYWMFGGISAFIVLCFSAAGYIYIQPLYCKDMRNNFLYLTFFKALYIIPVTSCFTTQMFLKIQEYLFHLQTLLDCHLKVFT